MLLKRADDKSKRLALLQDLQNSEWLDTRQKKWLRDEFMRVRKGIQGESESAFFLDQYFKDGENHVVLHDLRFVVDGDVAQIDHLVINRGVGMYLIETKNYAGSVEINDHGEFTVDYDGERFGVESPIEQSRRHERVLQRLLERLGIAGRTGAPLECHHVVMYHPKAIIKRPPKGTFDTSNVIKADQFPTWHGQFVDEIGVAKLMKLTVNIRSLETIKEWGEKLMRQHRPVNQLELPEFMKAKEPAPTRAPAPAPVTPQRASSSPAQDVEAKQVIAGIKAAAGQPGDKRLVCLQCSSKITFAEGKYCWNNAARFQGGQYCREHQALFKAG